MEQSGFDVLARAIAARGSRRAAVGALGLLAAPLLGANTPQDAAAKKNKKVTICVNGVTKKVAKNKRKKYLKRGATAGPCPGGCTPNCAAGSCGSDGCGGTCACPTGQTCNGGTCCTPVCTPSTCGQPDSCGGICGCASGQLCDSSNVCRACSVPCAGNAAACGTALQSALDAAPSMQTTTLYLCPGTYQGNFTVPVGERRINLIGAGDGADPVSNTILDGHDDGRVVSINNSTVDFTGVRIINGGIVADGGGIFAENNATVYLRSSTVTGNISGANGGGIAVDTSSLEVRDSTISENKAGSGGGMYCNLGFNGTDYDFCAFFTATVTENDALGGDGGGIWATGVSTSNMLEFNGTVISSNTASSDGGGLSLSSSALTVSFDAGTGNQVINNTAAPSGAGGGINNTANAALNKTDTLFSGNTPDQCAGRGCS